MGTSEQDDVVKVSAKSHGPAPDNEVAFDEEDEAVEALKPARSRRDLHPGDAAYLELRKQGEYKPEPMIQAYMKMLNLPEEDDLDIYYDMGMHHVEADESERIELPGMSTEEANNGLGFNAWELDQMEKIYEVVLNGSEPTQSQINKEILRRQNCGCTEDQEECDCEPEPLPDVDLDNLPYQAMLQSEKQNARVEGTWYDKSNPEDPRAQMVPNPGMSQPFG